MKRALRYLLDTYIAINLSVFVIFAVFSLAASQWLRIQFLATYYYMLPMMIVILVAIYSFNLTTIYRNLALSMNCRRTDFFWGSQIAFLIVGVGSTAICWLAGALPQLLGREYMFQDSGSFINGAPMFARPEAALFLLAVVLLLQPTGAAMGSLYGKHKVLATIFLVVVLLLCSVGTAALLLIQDGTLVVPPLAVGIFLGVLAVICAGCEAYFWRSNGRAVVM